MIPVLCPRVKLRHSVRIKGVSGIFPAAAFVFPPEPVERNCLPYDNRDMNKKFLWMLLFFVLPFAFQLPTDVVPVTGAPKSSEVTDLEELTNVDRNFNALYESTIASKNRLLRGERLEFYNPPHIYRYTLKAGEDIWTLVARTSLTIDTIATLNRLDFTGSLRGQDIVYLPDTIGLFFDAEKRDSLDLADRYGIKEENIVEVSDPLDPMGTLFFLPETQLDFVERTSLTGVVFYAPLMGIQTSSYGTRTDPFINDKTFHGGIDIATEAGRKVYAARWGRVVFAGEGGDYGTMIVIEHQYGYLTLYGHLEEALVDVDEQVESGQIIGKVGETGRTTGPHLHFEIRRGNDRLNPDDIPYLFRHQTGE
jgi:murein DD-endopeptidase MepM/ murein hydrolase activator NlpD